MVDLVDNHQCFCPGAESSSSVLMLFSSCLKTFSSGRGGRNVPSMEVVCDGNISSVCSNVSNTRRCSDKQVVQWRLASCHRPTSAVP